jgi:hypothetical protein
LPGRHLGWAGLPTLANARSNSVRKQL